MELVFQTVREDVPGSVWRALYGRFRSDYERWFLKEGESARPSYATCVQKLKQFMPELMPTYERLVELAGGSDLAARLLSLYRPTPYLTACSQVVWSRPVVRASLNDTDDVMDAAANRSLALPALIDDALLAQRALMDVDQQIDNRQSSIVNQPVLIRNYDYSPALCDATLLLSAWNGRRVMAMLDCLWGVLDGINESGLCVSLSFGGRKEVGDGFGVPLILRYVLEFCRSTKEAADVLRRVPSHMAYNVTLLDASGAFITAYASADRPTEIKDAPVATNHQSASQWHEYLQATRSVEREQFLLARLQDPAETVERLAARFLEPPLFSNDFANGWGTLYTAIYAPKTCSCELLWPGKSIQQSIDRFEESHVRVAYGMAKESLQDLP